MPDVTVDFKDVWNAVKDVATLINSSTTYGMGDRAFVVPKGLTPYDLDWSRGAEQDFRVSRRWGNRASDEYLDLGLFTILIDASPTLVRSGVHFTYGGRHEGKGLYIHDAYVWAVADSTAFAATVDATGQVLLHPHHGGQRCGRDQRRSRHPA